MDIIKAVDQCTGKVNYGTVIKDTTCYITVELKKYYSNGNSLITRLFKRNGAMSNDYMLISFYIVIPKQEQD